MIETMSLDDMREYLGQDQIPEDFDDFWKKQTMKYQGNIEYRLDKKDFNITFAQAYDLHFKGSNNSIVYAKCLFPKTNKPYPVVFYFHGYQNQSPDWSDQLNYVAAGYGVVSMDVRGQAGQSQDKGHFDGITVKGQIVRGMISGPNHLFYKDIYLDVFQLIDIIATLESVDSNQLYSYGWSQGGALALIAAALNPKIVKTVAVYPFLSDFRRVLDLGGVSEPYDELFRYFKYSDPFHKTENNVLKTLAYIDVKNFAHRISCPVVLLTALKDDICPPSTQFAIFNRLTSTKKHLLLPDYGHDPMTVQVKDHIFDQLTGSQCTKQKIE
ncbi:TPA: alpha/beta fold hydrolase [Streptococcus agalactiae]|uniref:alpha/beta fold hydrolase n=1 Tax=Streptococcus agalactiae TaxID=1311 RepID=UPI001143FEBF|nr:alpha/beta fold hydrolase [Streptococcus agalactiae]TQB88741.1 acetylxylan esterase [Streptococcus agalactiae]TQB93009.1 acetylxylan esterase [Streptococcus agalactiae]TQB97867.1 acetylxylan esterase [Streptococcus agalactiae]TQC00914.1 acetylxylan esterase [Streptococcus agalactiae]TQC02281.1 acetylxylan esterase [Streptococcus agalactiae]